jgi:hypothetical protein
MVQNLKILPPRSFLHANAQGMGVSFLVMPFGKIKYQEAGAQRDFGNSLSTP